MRINSSTIRVSRRVEAKNATGKYANILIFIEHGTETVQVTPLEENSSASLLPNPNALVLQCFETVGGAAGRAAGL